MTFTVLQLIGGHLANAPRPQKEAMALAKAGVNVLIAGIWTDSQLAKEDEQLARAVGAKFIPIIDLRAGAKGQFSHRIKNRFALEVYKLSGVPLPLAFGPGAHGHLKIIRKVRPNLVMAHCESGLWAGKISALRGQNVAVDFEDWFSEDLPLSARKSRPVAALKKLERWHLQNAPFTLTTTDVLAKSLQRDAQAKIAPICIPNVFPWGDRELAQSQPRDERSSECSFYWYSQTIGPGRGLELLFKTLRRVKGDWKLRIRGVIRNSTWWNNTLPPEIKDRIEVLRPVSNANLLARHMSHDVGLALEDAQSLSRDLTATNKIFDYLRAGLAVIATNTQGQSEVMSAHELTPGWVIKSGCEDSLFDALQSAVERPDLRKIFQSNALKLAETKWSWELFEDKLVSTLTPSVR